MKEIEFWFSIGSTYTYLSVTRLKEVNKNLKSSFPGSLSVCEK